MEVEYRTYSKEEMYNISDMYFKEGYTNIGSSNIKSYENILITGNSKKRELFYVMYHFKTLAHSKTFTITSHHINSIEIRKEKIRKICQKIQ